VTNMMQAANLQGDVVSITRVFIFKCYKNCSFYDNFVKNKFKGPNPLPSTESSCETYACNVDVIIIHLTQLNLM